MTRFGRVLALLGVLALGVVVEPRTALALGPFAGNFSLYDDFSSLLFDWTRWTPREVTIGGALSPNTDTFRGIVPTKAGPQAQLQLHSWGRQDLGNIVRRGDFQQRLQFPSPQEVTSIIAQITVAKAAVVGCKANTGDTTRALAVIGRRFFNTSPSGPPGNRTGDVFAVIGLLQDSGAGAKIVAALLSCDDPTCNSSSLVIPLVLFATGWKPNQPRNLGIQWDPDNDRFIVAVMDQFFTEIETLELDYAGIVSDTAAPFIQEKGLLIIHNIANCAPPGKRGEANMTALFDNVFVNQ